MSKNPAAVELGRRGGKKGGAARAANLTPKERSDAARHAANIRWGKPNEDVVKDEIWTMKDGTKIAVSDMSESHVRNALRMVIRVDRKRQMRVLRALVAKDLSDRASCGEHEDFEMSVGDIQDMLSSDAYNQLSNPNVFFPLLEGGQHGSPELAARHDPRRK